MTLWHTESFDVAIAKGEQEGHGYVDDNEQIEEFTGLAQAYHSFTTLRAALRCAH